MDPIRQFTLRGLSLRLPQSALRGGLAQALESGRYEKNEADAVERHLREGDRFVDFGAGIGFLCALAARLLGTESVTGVEAGPSTIAFARDNLTLNGFGAVELIHGAVTGAVTEGMTEKRVEFGLRRAFWASGLKTGEAWPEQAEVTLVPALPAAALLAELRPTVLSCDIEGAEREVLAADLPDSLRLIITEIHPGLYGPAGTREIFDALSARGFAYEPEGSRGATVVFRRIGAD